ncbi:MAG: outer membrane protein assembly factor BamE [Gammaproteobacteria bacterium]|nr:outer membrane protein assembly factor BamE [Gammaproteobacteria bacterium]NNC67843.1 outer membrane protein assembly factor BamE [Gammaproteobacteria bacterium]
MKYLKILVSVLILTSLLACQSKLLTVHKIDVQQGNALDAEMVGKVEIGMTQEQVLYILGSPLITDSFHPDRWDYIYLFIPGYGEKERRQLTLIFDRGEVIEIDRHNIVESDLAGTATDDTEKKDEQDKKAEEEKEELSKKEKEELKELEEQADALENVEDALDSNTP